MQEKIQRILKEYEDINQQLSNPEISSDPKKFKDLSIKLAGLEEVRGLAENYIQTTKELNESGELLKSEVDPDMITMAEEEIKKLRENEADIKKKLEVALLPKDPNDNKNVIIEIRAGAGGDEAGLFAANLFRMYQRYSEVKGYKTEILSSNRSGIGGYKEIIFMIKGQGAYQNFKYESGVHRVQRVPETEKQGRIHTSTITVAVLPEAEEVDLEINPSDLRIDTFCASGHGGQSVNTTYSAVRIVHLPTDTVVICQDERSQLKNRAKAMRVLRSRLLAKKEEEEAQKIGADRRSQVGTGDRSEKIRTYNYPQDRVTDHRIKLTIKNLNDFVDGNIERITKELESEDQKRKLDHATAN